MTLYSWNNKINKLLYDKGLNSSQIFKIRQKLPPKRKNFTLNEVTNAYNKVFPNRKSINNIYFKRLKK